MRKLMGTIMVLVSLVFFASCGARRVMFNIDCGGHMARAAKANSVDLASREMEIVVKYLEDHNLTKGNTAVLWNTPQQDLEFFYNNMKASLEELRGVKEDSSSLEKSNVLMKLRETLTTTDDSGSEELCVPFGISRAPYQTLFAVWLLCSVVLMVTGIITIRIGIDTD